MSGVISSYQMNLPWSSDMVVSRRSSASLPSAGLNTMTNDGARLRQRLDQPLAGVVDDRAEVAGFLSHDHLVVRLARRDHREAVLFLRHPAVEDHRASRLQHLLDLAVELVRVLGADAGG